MMKAKVSNFSVNKIMTNFNTKELITHTGNRHTTAQYKEIALRT